MIVTGAQVAEAAQRWVGVRFRHQGRDRHGIDCVGLPIVVLRELGVLERKFEIENYGRLPTPVLIDRITKHCTPLPAPVAGALVVIAWTRLAAHVAICTPENLIHSYESVGHVVEHGYRGRWLRLTHSVWALPGVTYE